MKLLKSFNIITVFLLSIILNLSCSEKPTTSPEEETSSDGFSLEATTTIGTQGGTITTDEFSLTVPAGSFSQQGEIRLYSADSSLFGEETVTKFFRLEGLPSDFTTQLRIAIKYNKVLTNESYIAVSENVVDELTGESTTVYNLEDAADSSGFLVGYLEPSLDGTALLSPNKSTSVNAENNKNVQAVSNYLSEYRSENFRFKYPTHSNVAVQKLASTLEKNYEIIKNSLKLSISKAKKQDGLWTVEMTYGSGIRRSSQVLLAVSKDMLEPSASTEFEIRSGQELLNIATREYYPEDDDYSPGDHWLSYALITWSAELFSSTQNLVWADDYHPRYTELDNSYFYSAFNGIRSGAEDAFRELYRHSVGMSALFKYLFDTSKIQKHQVGEIYELIKGGVNTTQALINTINGSKHDWWTDFFRSYLTGEIYNVNSNIFIMNPDGEWNIENDNDVLKEFGPGDPEIGQYADLSAKKFMINLNHPNIDESKKLVVSIEGDDGSEGLSTIVFSYNNSKLEYLGQSSSGVIEISNLKSFYDSGITQFLLVTVNSRGEPPYTDRTPVHLKLEVKDESSNELDYTFCHISIAFDYMSGISTNVETGETYENSLGPAYLDGLNIYWYIGSFTGNTFSGTGTAEVGTRTETGEITVELNDSRDMITNFKLSYETNFITDLTGKNTVNIEFEAENIPLGNQQGIYEVYNEEVCNHIISLDYHSINDLDENNFDTPHCDNSTFTDYIKLEFDK